MTIPLAGNFIVSPENKLLVIHRAEKWWEIIGGKILPGELSAYAAEREAQEEAGIAVRALKRIYNYEFSYRDQSFDQDLWWAQMESGTPYPREAIHDEIAWMSLRELSRHDDISPALAHLTKQLVDGEVHFSL